MIWKKQLEKKSFFQTDSLTFTGRLTYPKKNVKINFVVGFGAPKSLILPIDSTGNFEIGLDHLLQRPGTRLFLLLNSTDRLKLNDNYIIKINDPYQVMNAKLAKQFDVETPILPSFLPNNEQLVLKNNERAIRLKEVVIGPQKNEFKGNECGDYVCPYNILNCINHVGYAGNRLPKIGQEYLKYSGMEGTVKYQGCFVPNETIFFQVKPVYLNKEFYRGDYKDPLEPAFFSTIYWNYGYLLSGKKETELEFYTSDITGKFRIVVQGILNNDVVYAEKYFEVQGK